MFKKYVSNTSAPTGTSFNESRGVRYQRYRSFIKPLMYGTYNWRVYYMNQINSTFSDGSVSYRNKDGGEFKILSAKMFVASEIDGAVSPRGEVTVTFDGKKERDVSVNERFWSDEFSFTVSEGEFFVWEWELYGDLIPYNVEPLISSFIYEDGEWKLTEAPCPAFFGIERPVKKTVAFMGDSITAGCGTPRDKYEMWVARIAEMIKDDYASWNLGLGYGRCADCATLDCWLEKGLNADIVTLAYGVNDLCKGPYALGRWSSAGELLKNIETIVKELTRHGKEVILFSIPPFRFQGEQAYEWKCVNLALPELAKIYGCRYCNIDSALDSEMWKCDYIYGDHPNSEGCARVAEVFKSQFLVDGKWDL
jgi:hypothetical protein